MAGDKKSIADASILVDEMKKVNGKWFILSCI